MATVLLHHYSICQRNGIANNSSNYEKPILIAQIATTSAMFSIHFREAQEAIYPWHWISGKTQSYFSNKFVYDFRLGKVPSLRI